MIYLLLLLNFASIIADVPRGHALIFYIISYMIYYVLIDTINTNC